MQMPVHKLIAVAVLSAGFGITAIAQTTTTAPGRTAAGEKASSLSSADRKFMETAAQHGIAEVALGRIAAEKARSPEVKQFGERMVQDHTKANQQLMQLAQQKGVQLPKETDGKHKRMMESMSKMSADKFDREYMEEMVDDHKKDIGQFREAAKDAKDPDVKNFAATTLPVLEEHHKMAQSIHAKVKDMERSAGAPSSRPATGNSPAGASTR
jgi:putative membrane protein